MAQEEFWIYETLLKVVRNTNDMGSDPNHDAELQETAQPQRGPHQTDPGHGHRQRRRRELGQVARRPSSLCRAETGGNPADAGHRPTPQAVAVPTSSGDTGGSPLAGRYVDDSGKPLADPAQQPYGEFRMMPIDLKVVIEQKEIPRLLAECANSAMRIDVRRVRVLVQTPGPWT